MKTSIGWLLPETFIHNEKGHTILDVRMQTICSFEYLTYEEGDTWHLVIQVLGFGFCLNILKENK